MATAEIEPLSGIIRVFPEGSDYGDPYEWSAGVRWIDRETVEIVGAMRAPTPSERKAIRECLAKAGVKEVVITRHKDGRDYARRIKLKGTHHGMD